MKYWFIFAFLIPFSVRAQNLYPGIGISSDNISIVVYNPSNPPAPLKFKVNRYKPDISCLFDIRIIKSYYLKSGFYLNVRKYEFYSYFKDCFGGTCHWLKSYADPDHRIPVIIVPVLISWKPFGKSKLSDTHVDVGPYMGFKLDQINSAFLKSRDYGSEVSIGVGGKNTSINLFYIQSFINLAERGNYSGVEKITGNNFGINLAWKFRLGKK
jgi:hypothetical protein